MKVIEKKSQYATERYLVTIPDTHGVVLVAYDVTYHYAGQPDVHPPSLYYKVDAPGTYVDVAVTDTGYFTLSEDTGKGCQAIVDNVAKVYAENILGQKLVIVSGAQAALKSPAKYAARWQKKFQEREAAR